MATVIPILLTIVGDEIVDVTNDNTVDDISVNTVDALDDSPVTDILVGDWW